MAKFVKVILFLLLAVALHGVAGNVFTEKQVEQPEHAVTYSMRPQGQINAPESPYLPVALSSLTFDTFSAVPTFTSAPPLASNASALY